MFTSIIKESSEIKMTECNENVSNIKLIRKNYESSNAGSQEELKVVLIILNLDHTKCTHSLATSYNYELWHHHHHWHNKNLNTIRIIGDWHGNKSRIGKNFG